MPEWMHNRAEHILAKNPSMPKSEAFAIATQQMHALGKSPKGYGTAEGRETAKAKYDTPKDDKKTANPGGLRSAKMEKKAEEVVRAEAFLDELSKIAAGRMAPGAAIKMMGTLAAGGGAVGALSGLQNAGGLRQHARDNKDSRIAQFTGKHPVLSGGLLGAAAMGALPLTFAQGRADVARDIKRAVRPAIEGAVHKVDKHVITPGLTAAHDLAYAKNPSPEVEGFLSKFQKKK